MKKTIALLLTLVMLLAIFPASTVANAETVTKEGFYFVNWNGSADDYVDYDYCYVMPWFYTSKSSIKADSTSISVNVGLYNSSDPKVIAQRMKEDFNNRPKGARYVNLNTLTDTYKACVKDVVDMTRGVTLLYNWLDEFLAYYKSIGGELDGMAVDLEYNLAYAFYVEDKQYGSAASDSVKNKNIYNEIVANPVYKDFIRPRLVERGFEFWPADKIGGDKSEIWSMYRYSGSYYEKDRNIWDAVISELLAYYINEGALKPLLKYYPDAVLSDYHRGDTDSWLRGVNDHGSVVGKGLKAGNASNYNLYDVRPGSNFFKYSGSGSAKKRTVYITPPSFNDAIYEDTPYGGALWDVNLHKRLLASTDTGIINTWLAYFNYGKRYSRTPYYSEAVYHVGMLDPEPFFGYIIKSEVESKGANDPDPDVGDYYYNLEVVDQLLTELTRVAGSSDRKPIDMPITWNGSFMLTGMYSAGRNIWRITPDTTVVSKKDFKVSDLAPTFQVDGLTITFPQGRIIEDSKIQKIGTCGYWVETPANVMPIITGSADRFADNPTFEENFNSYSTGAFTSTTAYPHTYWTVNGSASIQDVSGNKAVALSGSTELVNTIAPANITAGDAYAKQQAWEITVTLPNGDYGDLRLLRCTEADGGFKIEDGKLYYSERGAYKELCSVSAGTYTLKREVDFRTANSYTCSFHVYDAQGKLIKEVKNVPMPIFTTPVQSMSLKVTGASATVLLDDYKLYPTGVSTTFDLYETKYGKNLNNSSAVTTTDTAYRLTWMNASGDYKVAKIVEAKSGKVIETVQMGPGKDGVATGVVAENGNSLQLKVEISDATAPAAVDYSKGNFAWSAPIAESLGLAVGPKGPVGDGNNGTSDGPANPGDGTITDDPSTDPTGNGGTTPDGGNTSNGDNNTGSNGNNTGNNGNADSNTGTEPGQNAKKGGKVALIVILAVVVLGGGGFAAYWFVIKPKQTPKPKDQEAK